ncbi:Rhodanese-like domain-containing protein [Gloeopeniophorella convolvens]|nr:Rhodanese-like domain-containing protein [Gloeopeniophorella convolvens]
MPVRYISGDELSTIIKSDKVPRKDYLVVDVRDDDYVGGNIIGAHNSPSERFHEKVDALVRETTHVPQVIFHCALSQSRGPTAARLYNARRNVLQEQGKDDDHEVLILRGGFSQFQAKFKDDPKLVENYNKNFWEEWQP